MYYEDCFLATVTVFSECVAFKFISDLSGTPLAVWFMPKYLHIHEVGVLLLASLGRILQSCMVAFAPPSMSYLMYIGASLNILKDGAAPQARSIMNFGLPAEDTGAYFFRFFEQYLEQNQVGAALGP